MVRPFLLARAGLGLAALGVEHAVALPGRAARGLAGLPSLPVRLAGSAVQTYLHVGQTVTGLAVRGDRVIGALVPAPRDTPSWAQFDEDAPGGPAAGDAPPVGEVPDLPVRSRAARGRA